LGEAVTKEKRFKNEKIDITTTPRKSKTEQAGQVSAGKHRGTGGHKVPQRFTKEKTRIKKIEKRN
jgi:hypothetical protein